MIANKPALPAHPSNTAGMLPPCIQRMVTMMVSSSNRKEEYLLLIEHYLSHHFAGDISVVTSVFPRWLGKQSD